MDKKQFVNVIREAIEKGPFKQDVKRIALFGSFLRGTATTDSDIDLLVEFSPQARIGFFKFVDLQENLEKASGHKIDLLTPEALSKHIKQQILQSAETIYEG